MEEYIKNKRKKIYEDNDMLHAKALKRYQALCMSVAQKNKFSQWLHRTEIQHLLFKYNIIINKRQTTTYTKNTGNVVRIECYQKDLKRDLLLSAICPLEFIIQKLCVLYDADDRQGLFKKLKDKYIKDRTEYITWFVNNVINIKEE